MADPDGKWFLATRNDGFGARLSAMLDALWLAGCFGGRFGLLWPDEGLSQEHNSILPAREVFCPDWLAAHRVEARALRDLRTAPIGTAQRDFRAALQAGSGIEGFRIDWRPLAEQAAALGDLVPIGADRAAAFRAIRFAPALEAARDLADSVPLAPRTVALHLRAGDIVYGRWRASGVHHGKVVAYPVAMELLRREAEAQCPVLLFGQDRALAEHARDRWGARLAEDLSAGQGFGATAQALFEIALMARCRRILAGESGFGVAAAKIAGVARTDPRTILRPPETRALIRQALRDPAEAVPASAQQRAMAAWHAVIARRHDLATPEGRAMLAEAIRHDPANPYYRAMEALALYRAGDAAAADAAMLGALAGPPSCPALVRHLAEWLAKAPVLGSAETAALLEGFAREGWPGAALLLALRARSARQAEAAAGFARVYAAGRPAGMPASLEALLAA